MSSAPSNNNYVSTRDGDVQFTSKNPKTGHRHTRTLSGFLDAARVSDDGNTSSVDVIATSNVISTLMQQQAQGSNRKNSSNIMSSNNNSSHSSQSPSSSGAAGGSSTTTHTQVAGIMKPSSHSSIFGGSSKPPTTSSTSVRYDATTLKRHRRGQSSGGGSAVLHRRVNSIGSSVVINSKNTANGNNEVHAHQRENSGGLDMLSAVADCFTEEEMAAVAGSKGNSTTTSALKSSLRQRHSRGHSLIGGPIDLNSLGGSSDINGHQPGGHKQHARSSSLLGSLDHTGTALLMSLLPGNSTGTNSEKKADHTRNHSLFSLGGDSINSGINPNVFAMNTLSPIASNDHQLVDTTATPGASEITNVGVVDVPSTSSTATVGHQPPMTSSQAAVHEAMIQGFASYNKYPLQQQQQMFSHHRPQSSTSKFLMSLEESIDANIPGGSDFLRTLAMSNDADAKTNTNKAPSVQNFFRPPPISANPKARPNLKPKVSIEIGGKTPLSSNNGGALTRPLSKPVPARAKPAAAKSPPPKTTSKRVRRKCNVEGCPNRVVQGGLCISHGAKRKVCSVAGCDKNVKKAGLCSAHGPARKRCEFEGCSKVAVQGGKCISHGARKKLCEYEGCTKQAILSGMCKKHRDEKMGLRAPATCTPAAAASSAVPKRRQRAVHAPLDGNTVFPPSAHSPVAGAPVCMVIGGDKVGQSSRTGAQKLPSPPQHTRRESFRGDNATVEAIFAATNDMIHASTSNPVTGASNNRLSVPPRSNASSQQARQSQQQPPQAEQAPDQESDKPNHKHKRGISLFTEESVADTILRNGNLII
mmetsp:Transcript_7633/g.11211  ORF Transcript_7633/g.11211 Transcript_7633/m.11211 type:complete len:812 (-) Transcript_7633:187-2622(-)|eukprot:CAMPEP_0196814992 /NCGR_PEP_ID=MMETSP1362-20130617/47204_1 /TAXON_ID=163516 /ORGANISM="Leptocylindrus danicus, Strain CCMP1856" /LENGTH=811 /DNA_ID=CAMNT_0042191813 /DNA_START=370 /DNA_END=2805 /DNA_ORIENTATION=-